MSTHPEWRATTKYTVGIGLAIFGIYVLYLSRGVLPSLIIAALIAFLLRPVINFMRHKLHFPKGLAVLVTYFLAIVVLLLSPLVILPPVVSAVNYLAGLDYQALITGAMTATVQWLEGVRASGISILGFAIHLDALVDPLLVALRDGRTALTPQLPSVQTILQSIQSVFSVSYGVVGSVSSGVLSSFYLFLASIYLSSMGDDFPERLFNRFPASYRQEIVTLIVRVQHVWDAFFRGQISLMVIIGVVVWIGGMILGLPGAGAMGVVAGLLEIIPSLGPIISTVPAVIVALLQGSSVLPVNNLTFALIIIIFYALVQALENNLIVPKVLGEAVNLHPLLVMTGVLVGASVAGILGALLAAPTLATIKELVSYSFNKIMGQEPFPEPLVHSPDPLAPLIEKSRLLLDRILDWARKLYRR